MTIFIESNVDTSLWESDFWKDQVCKNFDENLVCIGNKREFPDIVEASWWTNAINAIRDIDNSSTVDEFIEYYQEDYGDVSKDLYEMYEKFGDIDDPEFMTKFISILDKSIELEYTTIKGNSQGDWEHVIYVKNSVDIKKLSDWYFGYVLAVIDDEHKILGYITDTEYMDNKNNLKSYIVTKFSIDENFEINLP